MSNDDGNEHVSGLDYLSIHLSLFSNMTMMKQELIHVKELVKTNFDVFGSEQDLQGYMNTYATRKAYLLRMASQILTSEDYSQFKDMVEATLITTYTVTDENGKKEYTF